jgi:hypothetical protein
MISLNIDGTTSLPRGRFHFSPDAQTKLQTRLATGSVNDFYLLFTEDLESEDQQLLALQLLETLLISSMTKKERPLDSMQMLESYLTQAKETLQQRIKQFALLEASERKIIFQQRALLSLLAGCWLDYVSQPATEPALIVCQLSSHNFQIKGNGEINNSQQQRRYRHFAELDIHIPEVYTSGILSNLRTTELTVWQATFWLAISRLPASYLPEIIGFHYAYYSLGFDDALLGMPALISEQQLEALLNTYLSLCQNSPSGEADIQRLLRSISAFVTLELDHSAMLLELKNQLELRTLDDRMAEIIRRHMPFAGKQHQRINVEKKPLPDWFGGNTPDVAAFLTAFRRSPYLRQSSDGSGTCSFQKAIHFGGSMFGIFSQEEAETMARWIKKVRETDCKIELTSEMEAGAERASYWCVHCRSQSLDTLVNWQKAVLPDDRELFFRLVNIERFANHLEAIKTQVSQTLQQAEILFTIGSQGRYTDASYFDFSPSALRMRTDAIYWEKLVQPYQRLTQIPDRESVIFNQKLMALGSMIDGAWAHKFGGTLRYHRDSDGMMLAIYADEMGLGNVEKNHITLILQVINSMGIQLPHIREKMFCQQDELPDTYAFSLHQLGMSLFPDTFYEELLGYNLGIEMLGLGEMRMHEIQKLRHYGFDTIYEEAHLTIDNFSAGHSRQSIDLIIAYLESLRAILNEEELQYRWRRIWRGYASFAYFLETDLTKNHSVPSENYSELVI